MFTVKELAARQIYRVHPAFRVIATASVDSTPGPLKWFSQEMGTIFQFLKLNEMSVDEETLLLTSQTQCPPDTLEKVLRFAQAFRKLGNARGHQSVLANSVAVSTRQLVRLCKRAAFPDSDLYSLIHNICLRPFLPHLAKLALDEMLADIGIKKPTHRKVEIFDEGSVVRFGDVVVDKYKAAADDHEAETLIPYTNSEDNADRGTSFYSNTDHNRILRDLALDFSLGEHLLVIGNQGVGKNRLTDRFLELMRYPREYIQLHRDTTVQALLVQPVLEHGRIVYRDSPLIKAVRFGRVLVVDEADKAPVYITSILKSLVETGEMDVSDGRKIRRIKTHVDDIEVHPNFRMIVLANRPGFPFLGNDFFASIGQVFGTYPIENPSFESEVALLCQKAPSVSVDLIRKLVGAFGDLRTAFDDGLVSYPYSLRELIHLVSHLDAFPHDSIESVLRNVFDFDVHQRDFTDFLVETFKKHGIILNQIGLHAIQTMTVDRQLAVSYSEKTPPAISEPKHGKVDDKNEPHVGGNTWAGGTGGSDTAGLGGRGGPYRLDSGNPIKQLPDELKNNVPEHVLKAAREMGRDALKKKLQDIKMSPYESEVYTSLYDNVKIPIQQLKVILDSVKSKQKERVWIRNQIEGELDDTKLVEGITGEHSIYKRRGLEDQGFGVQQLPKRIKFVFDVSGSMYRFNSYDQRLTKSLETAALVMESLKGMEDKYVYDIVGHSGDSACIPIVKAHNPPKNEKEILDVLMEMQAHAQYCWSGDNTMNATMRAIQDVTAEPADDYYVIVLSDANLKRYGIGAEEFSNVIEFDSRVSTTVLFIGSIGDEAVKLTRLLPKGRAFVAKHSGQIPMFMKDIFSSIA
ncbi:hypothetical protein HDV02_002756 [Globomyces sp. JEL0801]|nr:hypothetical protein HDV02_002756 [Globomyces sp. JEL0801]